MIKNKRDSLNNNTWFLHVQHRPVFTIERCAGEGLSYMICFMAQFFGLLSFVVFLFCFFALFCFCFLLCWPNTKQHPVRIVLIIIELLDQFAITFHPATSHSGGAAYIVIYFSCQMIFLLLFPYKSPTEKARKRNLSHPPPSPPPPRFPNTHISSLHLRQPIPPKMEESWDLK